MEQIWSSEIDLILSVGRNLESAGVRNWALERGDALSALQQLSIIGVAVLGGDTYSVAGPVVQPNYDSWYCNRDRGEPNADFVERSIAKAMDYIGKYQAPVGGVLFAIVPDA